MFHYSPVYRDTAMLNRKLLEVLKHLGEEDRQQLRLFLASPYFNRAFNADQILRLYDLLLLYDVDEAHPALEKAAVAALMFPGKTYREKAKGPVDTLASDLFQLVRRFCAQRDMEAQHGDVFENLAMARIYRGAGLEERFEQVMQAARRLQEESPWRDLGFYYWQFRIEEEEHLFRALYNSVDDDVNLSATQTNLDMYYAMKRLDFACVFEYQQRRTQIEPLPTKILTDSIWQLTEASGPLDAPLNRIYRLIIQLIRNPDEAGQLEQLEQLLEQYQPIIPEEQFRNLKTYSRMFLLQRYRKSGDAQSRHKIFEMYAEHLEKGYFYIDGKIPMTSFRNLIIFALKLGKEDWVRHFLDTHPPERIGGTRYPADVFSLNLAEYQFHLGHYDAAQETLVYRLFEHPGMSITADLLLIKIYFETQSELLSSRMKALDQKVRRTNQAEVVKERYLNFLRKLAQIIKYGWQKRSRKRQELIDEIQSTPEIVAREWLLKQLEQP